MAIVCKSPAEIAKMRASGRILRQVGQHRVIDRVTADAHPGLTHLANHGPGHPQFVGDLPGTAAAAGEVVEGSDVSHADRRSIVRTLAPHRLRDVPLKSLSVAGNP